MDQKHFQSISEFLVKLGIIFDNYFFQNILWWYIYFCSHIWWISFAHVIFSIHSTTFIWQWFFLINLHIFTCQNIYFSQIKKYFYLFFIHCHYLSHTSHTERETKLIVNIFIKHLNILNHVHHVILLKLIAINNKWKIKIFLNLNLWSYLCPASLSQKRTVCKYVSQYPISYQER